MRLVRAALIALPCAVFLPGCPADDEVLTHGFVQLDMRRGESQMESPFGGTAQVVATMQYEECLSSFYANNPAMRAEGPDGSKVFGGEELGGEGWKDRLCDGGQADDQADCEIVSIVQQFGVVEQMTITYQINAELEGRRLLFGPLPTQATAKCDGGLLPVVRIGSNGAVKGKDGNGNDLWQTESFSPPSAVTNQGGPIRIGAARP